MRIFGFSGGTESTENVYIIMQEDLLDGITRSKAGVFTMAICPLESQRVQLLLSPRSRKPQSKRAQHTAPAKGWKPESFLKSCHANLYGEAKKNWRPVSKHYGEDWSSSGKWDTSFFFPFLCYPGYKPIGWCRPHLGWVFLSQFDGLHVSHPQICPESCFTLC